MPPPATGRGSQRARAAPLAYMTQRQAARPLPRSRRRPKPAPTCATASRSQTFARTRSRSTGEEVQARIVIGADGCNGTAARAARARRRDRARRRARGELPVRRALRARDGARDRRRARRLRLGLSEGRPRQRRRRRRRERRRRGCASSCAGSARCTRSIPTAATETRGYRLPMRRPTSASPAVRRRVIGDAGRPRRPVLRRRHVRGVPLRTARRRRGARRARGPRRRARAVRRGGRAADHAADRGGLGREGARSTASRARRSRIARLPFTFRALEKLLQGEIAHPAAARGLEKGAIRLIYRVAKPRDLKRSRPAADPSFEPNGPERTTHACRRARRHRHPPEGRTAADLPDRRRPPADGGRRSRSTTRHSRPCSRSSAGARPRSCSTSTTSGDLDIAYQDGDLPRFRVNAYRQRSATSFAFRVIPKTVPSFEQLNMPRRREAAR